MSPKVKSVNALPEYTLELEFDNGEKGFFSMIEYLQYPVYKPLMNVDLFKQAKVTMGFVSWNEYIDMSRDTLYLESNMIANI